MTDWFDRTRDTLEAAYAGADEPWRQSGFAGPEERWVALRRPVAEAVDRSGSFLDVGCANGYLLACLLGWTAERGLAIEPFGIDLSERLVALARERLPAYRDQLLVANGWSWRPERRFDFVRTELVYVPAEAAGAYLDTLLEYLVAPGGRLLVANYAEGHPEPAATAPPGSQASADLLAQLAAFGFVPERVLDGLDPLKGRRTRVAVIRA